MSLITESLDSLALSPAQLWANLAMFPLLRSAAFEADYLVLDEALKRESARVTEVSEGGSVPELAFENSGDLAVLLLDGEELIGARQNRVLNTTVLVGGKCKIVIPVSCVEQGRWGYNSREFASADRTLFATARAKKTQRVSESLRANGSYRSDQGEVWDDIATKSAAFATRSDTGAMSDVFEQAKPRLDDFVTALRAVPDQCGALFAIDGRPVGLELFDSAQTFAHYLPKLVRSYAMDAVDKPQPVTERPAEVAAQAFLSEVRAAPGEAFPAVGEGQQIRLEGAAIVGSALLHRDRVLHLAAFNAEASGRPRMHTLSAGARRLLHERRNRTQFE